MTIKAIAVALALFTSTTVFAANSTPQPVPVVDTIPAARDIPYPGTMTVKVDATDLDRAIFRVEQTIPVAVAGRMTLLVPQWLPGNHAPRGQIEKIAGLTFMAGGKVIPWTRDTGDVFAFHIDVPVGARTVEARFQFLSATAPDQGRIVVTQEMMNLQWESVSLYPAGYFTRQIPVTAIVTWPKGWQAATALRPIRTEGDTVTYGTVSYDVLQDSPVFAGKYFRRDDLGNGVSLATVADDPKELVVSDDVLSKHRNMVTQTLKLFGAKHYDHYDFLHAITDRMGGIGLEHHRSSENQNDPGYFTDWAGSLVDHNLLPHEFVHSWNGKFRRGADLWTPDFKTPMRNSLLWVYEGQTQFWGTVIEARSGMSSKADVLDKIAGIAAQLDTLPGRQWRALQDTTNDPIISARRPKGWASWQRSEDYYNESMLIWIEADAVIREGTGGAKGMDDFARAFFGINDGDWGQVTYTFDDVVKTLNGVMPYDWSGFLRTRLDRTGGSDKAGAPLAGFTKSGYRLIYTDTPTNFMKAAMKSSKTLSLTYSLGLTMSKAKISAVVWDSPAFKAGLTTGQEIVAVNGVPYSDDAIKAAITAAKGGKDPIRLTLKTETRVRDVAVQWNGGLRYPRFEKVPEAADGPLDRLLAPQP
jgi:predicted metalloprotease with PDZ domain